MNVKRLITVFFMLAATGLFSACTTIRELPREVRTQENPGQDTELCRRMLIAFLKNDPKGFISELTEEKQKEFDKKKFAAFRRNIIDSLGEPISFQYVTKLELMTFTPHIWKIRFKRTDPRTDKEFTSEVLCRIVTGFIDSKPVVISFHFL